MSNEGMCNHAGKGSWHSPKEERGCPGTPDRFTAIDVSKLNWTHVGRQVWVYGDHNPGWTDQFRWITHDDLNGTEAFSEVLGTLIHFLPGDKVGILDVPEENSPPADALWQAEEFYQTKWTGTRHVKMKRYFAYWYRDGKKHGYWEWREFLG